MHNVWTYSMKFLYFFSTCHVVANKMSISTTHYTMKAIITDFIYIKDLGFHYQVFLESSTHSSTLIST